MHLEWQAERAVICQGCGHPLDETTDPARAPVYATQPVTCWGCASKERTERSSKPGPGTRARVIDRSKG